MDELDCKNFAVCNCINCYRHEFGYRICGRYVIYFKVVVNGEVRKIRRCGDMVYINILADSWSFNVNKRRRDCERIGIRRCMDWIYFRYNQ